MSNWRSTSNCSHSNPDLPGKVSPREYLKGKPFAERYQFGLKILREKFGIIK